MNNKQIAILFFNYYLPGYLQDIFHVKITHIKKENPLIFFQLRIGKLSIELNSTLLENDIFKLKINGDLKKVYKTSEELVEDIGRYI
jgi:hypothetical protein